ncbi:unnamed protein product [Symbiodinium natans]|uniref:Uncharacterized protein n=1 Tax=Symbiodinium natans TaxID=878477 RepID=A0A812V566_9DINO|nr:unnamed protein product [Symbiodinium natans]
MKERCQEVAANAGSVRLQQEELAAASRRIAELQGQAASAARQEQEWKEAAKMLKDRTRKFKDQEAKKLDLSKKAQEAATKAVEVLEAKLAASTHHAESLEDEVRRLNDALTGAAREQQEQRAIQQQGEEELAASLGELRRQMQLKKDQVAIERERVAQLEVANAALRNDLERLNTEGAARHQDQVSRIQRLSEELAEVTQLRERVGTLESLQRGMGDCLQDSQRRTREAELKAEAAHRELAEMQAAQIRSRLGSRH